MPDVSTPLAERIVRLLRHLGIVQVHFAACMPRDWQGLLASHPELVSSLTLINPMGIAVDTLQKAWLPVLCIAGDRGRQAQQTARDLTALSGAVSVVLRDYFSPPWADPITDRRAEIAQAISDFLSRAPAITAHDSKDFKQTSGETAEITYTVRGKGAPLLLMPLALAPSQWEALIEPLSQQFCTITLGGPHLGMVAHLETRAQSSYMRVIDLLVNELQLQPSQSLLEVGCGPGAIVCRLAKRTQGANRIVAVDVNRYLLREAAALAKRDGLDRFIEFHEGDAEKLPFSDRNFDATISCTVMEEGDANRMLGEFIRVTKPGGRVGAVVRSIDLPRWVNLPLAPELKRKVEAASLFGGNVSEQGCADTSLYARMIRAGLINVTMLPQWASHNDGERLKFLHDRIVACLDSNELADWRAALAKAETEGTFFIAEPFHCAVGRKP